MFELSDECKAWWGLVLASILGGMLIAAIVFDVRTRSECNAEKAKVALGVDKTKEQIIESFDQADYETMKRRVTNLMLRVNHLEEVVSKFHIEVYKSGGVKTGNGKYLRMVDWNDKDGKVEFEYGTYEDEP